MPLNEKSEQDERTEVEATPGSKRENAAGQGGEAQKNETQEPSDAPRRIAMTVAKVTGIIAAAFVVSILVRLFVLTPYEIPTGSMEDTIAIDDRVFAEKISYMAGEPQVGDIVIFQDPESPKRTLIKRVVALSGQTVSFAEGKLVVDGKTVEESYVKEGSVSEPLAEQAEGVSISYPYTVPEGHVWVMGDNRENSQDSRYFGPVPVDTVVAKAFFRYWPASSIGGIY